MHGAGVRRERYGTHGDLADVSAEFAAFVGRQESRQRTLLDRLRAHDRYGSDVDEADRRALAALHAGDRPATDSGVFRDYRLLQVWDRLSLHCCRAVEHGAATIGSVPVAPGDPDTELSVTPVGGSTFEIDPFPFRDATVVTRVRTRRVDRSAVSADGGGDEGGSGDERGCEDELVRAYYDAPVETVRFEFVA
jgi:hypothetical protein